MTIIIVVACHCLYQLGVVECMLVNIVDLQGYQH